MLYLHDFLSDRKCRVSIVYIAMLMASGCASNAKVRAQQEDIDTMKRQFADLKAQVGTLGSRLDSVEGKLAAATAPPPASSVSGLPGTGVNPHPSEGIGSNPEHLAAAGDPEPGFINDEAVQDFRKAMIFFEAGRYADSAITFASFLERYPDHPFAGSAQFYLGKSYFLQKDYTQAYDEFQRVLTTYDRSSHVAETLRDLSETEEQLHKGEDAARHRQLLSSLFPQSPAYASAPPSAAPRNVIKLTPPPGDEFVPPPKIKKPGPPAAAPSGSRASQLDDPPPPASSFAPPMPDAPPTVPIEKTPPKPKPEPKPGDTFPATEDKS